MAMRTAVVIAGAVARGAYEAGALKTVLSELLTQEDLRETLFVGTSAGAINAVLWAGLADGKRSVPEIGDAVCTMWESLRDTDVFAPLSSAARATSLLFSGKGKHLLDTKPFADTVTRKFSELSITENIASGHVGGVAIAATFCGSTAAGARSDVFYQSNHKPRRPKPFTAIRYLPARIEPAHVLASSAVPALFAPIEVNGAFYVDGGVRLNTPMAPAIDFRAQRIILVSSHATFYPRPLPLPHPPTPDDSVALLVHTMLADKMIEDLARLRQINQLKLDHPKVPFRSIEHVVVSPEPGLLARQARAALDQTYRVRPSLLRPGNAYRAARYSLIEAAIERLGSGTGADELLSYVLFDPGYFVNQIAQGERDAAEAAKLGWQLVPPAAPEPRPSRHAASTRSSTNTN